MQKRIFITANALVVIGTRACFAGVVALRTQLLTEPRVVGVRSFCTVI